MSEVVGLVCAEWLLDLQGLMAHLPESWLVSTDLGLRIWVRILGLAVGSRAGVR